MNNVIKFRTDKDEIKSKLSSPVSTTNSVRQVTKEIRRTLTNMIIIYFSYIFSMLLLFLFFFLSPILLYYFTFSEKKLVVAIGIPLQPLESWKKRRRHS